MMRPSPFDARRYYYYYVSSTGSRALGGTFTPAALSNLIGWYSADVGAYTDAGTTLATGGQTVQQWNDRSSVGNHLSQSTSDARPTFTTGVQNGKPGIVFSTATVADFMANASFALGGTTASVFCVIKGSSPGDNSRVVSFTGNGQASDFGNTPSAVFMFFNSSSTKVNGFRNGGTLSNGTVTDGTFNQLGSVFDGANHTLYINGTAQTAAANSDTFGATGTLSIGAQADGTNPFDGTFLEIVVTSSALSSTQRTQLASYFTTKWAV
jgi:hypothetical protein